MPFELTKEYLEKIEQAIEVQDATIITTELEDLYPADILAILYELDDDDQRKYVIDMLSKQVGAEIISYMDETFRKDFLKKFDSAELAAYIDHVDSDDAADILNQQPIRVREEVIALLEDRQKARYIIDLLHYDEDCAGGLMAKELVKANVNLTVGQCIEEIRRQAEKVEKVMSVYVVDDAGILLGRVSLKKLLLSRDRMPIADLYDDDILSVETYRPAEEVADIMQRYSLESIPVVNVHNKLLGRITIDDIVDLIKEQADQDRQAMTGLTEDIEEADTVWMLSRARLPWLFIGMIGGLLGSRFIGLFEAEIAIIPAMASFIPIITATGGNVGIQSSSIILQSLANKATFEMSFSKRLWKVFLVALINGVVISSIVLGFNMAMGHSVKLGFVVSTALFSVILLSSFMGTITPIVLDRMGVNPAVSSGPFITTTNDLIGLTVYFSVAHLLYNL